MPKCKTIKKGWKITFLILSAFILLLSGLYLAFQSQRVQLLAIHKITSYVSKNLKINIHVENVNISPFRSIILKNVWMEDQDGDTLAFASKISAHLDKIHFRKKLIDIKYVHLDEIKFHLKKDSAGIFNFQFLKGSPEKIRKPKGEWGLICNNFILKDSEFKYEAVGEKKTSYNVKDITLLVDSFRFTPEILQFQLSDLTLTDSKGFSINGLSAGFRSTERGIRVHDLRFETDYSRVDSASLLLQQDTLPGSSEKKLFLQLSLLEAKISMADLAMFIPSLEGMKQNLDISGEISGNPDNLKARDLVVKTGNNTLVNCDLTLSRFDDVSEPFLFIDLKRSYTDFRDLSRIKLPLKSKVEFLRFPASLLQTGTISYQGNFTGFLSDFVAYGTIDSQMGRIKTDLSFVPGATNTIKYNGQLETYGFNLGKLMDSKYVGEISLNGMVKGTYNKTAETISGDFNGTISDLYANSYNYRNIKLNGNIDRKKFDGNIIVDDPGLKCDFTGVLNLNEKVPVFDFILNLRKADLAALKADTLNPVSNLKFEMAANFSGNSIDNLDGLIQVFDGRYMNQNDSLHFNNLTINTHLEEKLSQITLLSDFFDGAISGTYHFNTLLESFRNVIAAYLPALKIPVKSSDNTNQFSFELKAKKLDELTAVFIPELKILKPFHISGQIDTNKGLFEMEGKIPEVLYNNLALSEVYIKILPGRGKLTSTITATEIQMKNSLNLKNLSLVVDAAEDRMQTGISWNNEEKRVFRGNIESEIFLTAKENSRFPVLNAEFLPTVITIADSAWHLSSTKVVIDTSTVSVEGFSFRHGSQEIAASGKISHDASEQMNLFFKNIDLAYFENYLKKPQGIKGILNGNVGISDFYESRLFNSDLFLTGFEVRDQLIGDISLINKWDRIKELINSEFKIVKNDRTSMLATGLINPANKNLDFIVDLNDQPLVLLGTVIRENLTNFHGDGTGRVRLYGTPDRLLTEGAVFCSNAGLTIDFTQVSYNFNDSVRFKDDKIVFDNIRINDLLKNRGIFKGNISQQGFRKFAYDLSVTSDKILALNTTLSNNEQFYGKAIVRGKAEIKGRGREVKLSGEFTSLPETSVTIVLDDDAEVARYDFVRFVTADDSTFHIPDFSLSKAEEGLEVDLVVHATPSGKVEMVYNTQISDLISARGEGTFRFRMDKAGAISLSGNYILEEGDYLFTVQDVINKHFTVAPGGSVTWSGDPTNAIIDLNAIYKLKASVRELMVGTTENLSSSQRIPVECKIILTGELIKPEINFSIEFPGIEDRLKDELQQYFATQEDLNRQMLSLLVLGRFYTPEYVRGSYAANTSGLIGNTASDLFSNQLSNWLSQINKDVDIGFNYRPGNQISNDEIEVALSTQIFNDRVSINGNIGNNANHRNLNSNELVGDFEITVKLSPNGKLLLKAYNRANNNLIYETAPYTQGLGFSYKENYHTFTELFDKLLALFKKRNTRIP